MTSDQPARARLYLFDTTLRDGQQTPGIDFTLEDKIQIAAMLDQLGVDYVEGGYPGANETDDAFFAEQRTENATFTAFGMTKRAGRSAANDPGLQAILNSAAPAVCYVAKSWDFHVDVALGISLSENLECIGDTIATSVERGKEAMLDCEHFFDGYKANPDYAMDCIDTALQAGARWVVLCDTNGGTLPHEISDIVSTVCARFPGDKIGIHTHDDTGNAVANSLAAVRAGARQIQGTLNGIGERCGNANLVTLIGALALKGEFAEQCEISIGDARLQRLTDVSRAFDELLNRAPETQAPFVGASAFATKAGIHASAILKDPRTYEHIEPTLVGNQRAVMVSDQAGKSNLLSELNRMGIQVEKKDPMIDGLLQVIKAREAEGYAYEAADASLELLCRRTLRDVPTYFKVLGYRTAVERRYNANGRLITQTEAVVKTQIAGETLMSVAEGNGPVNALDAALRKDLGGYQQYIEDLELVDFKVRILNGGTEAITRVLIESKDGDGNRWSTLGVSANIVEASFEALLDSIIYKLNMVGAKPL